MIFIETLLRANHEKCTIQVAPLTDGTFQVVLWFEGDIIHEAEGSDITSAVANLEAVIGAAVEAAMKTG